MDEHFFKKPTRSDDLPLFNAPRIETPAPVAPGSESSRRAAKKIEPHRPSQFTKILLALAASDVPLTREEICARTGLRESSACARLSELSPLWISVNEGAGKSSSGVSVNTYELTPAGRARCQNREAA